MHASFSDMTSSERILFNQYKRKHRDAFPDNPLRKTRNHRYYDSLKNGFNSQTMDVYLKSASVSKQPETIGEEEKNTNKNGST